MTPDTPPLVDGITPAPEPAAPEPTPAVAPAPPSPSPENPDERKRMVSRLKFVLVLFILLPYACYAAWSFFLLSVLPDPTGNFDMLIPVGKLVAMFAAGLFLLAAGIGVMRAGKNSDLSDRVRYTSFVRLGLFAAPGLILSVYVSLTIGGEPALSLTIAAPPRGTDLVAPVSISYSAESAVAILSRRGLKPLTYDWDFNGDGKVDQQTVLPLADALYDRQGTNLVTVKIALNNGSSRTLTMRITIPHAVFSYTPVKPVVNDAVRFSVAHLIPTLANDVTVRDVQWDFNGDGVTDQAGTTLQATHTFLRTGPQDVSVTILYSNQTQSSFVRTIIVKDPDPLPFPVRIQTTPEFLESPPPFQVLFHVETDEPVQDILWDFSDGSKDVGDRVGHTFREKGLFPVLVEIRSKNGQIAKITKTIKVVDSLMISDLTFDGSHQVNGDIINATAPVAIDLTPKTSMPLVNFFWEAPKASEVVSTDNTLKATFRNEGSYSLILIGQDAEGSVLRKTITLNVLPQQGEVTFDMKPTQGTAPLSVKFDATDTNIPGQEITGFVWKFGDADEKTQLLDTARVEHTFLQPGTFTVTLTVYTTAGTTKSASKTIVVRAATLDACFVMSRTSGPAPLGIHFDRSCTTGLAKTVLWDFDDGAQSDESGTSVDHVFQEPGHTYTVRLQLQDQNGISSTTTQQVHTD